MTELNLSYQPIRKLLANDQVDEFDCEHLALSQYLKRFAFSSQKANSAQTYVCTQNEKVVGFYSLAVGSVEPANASARMMKGQAKHLVPIMILARLSVDAQHTKRGLGSALLKDALLRTAQAAQIAGIRALMVHAKDEAAKTWYQRFDFESSPSDPFHLFLLLKDIQLALK